MDCPTEKNIARTAAGADIYEYTDRATGDKAFFVVLPGYNYKCEDGEWIVYTVPGPAPKV